MICACIGCGVSVFLAGGIFELGRLLGVVILRILSFFGRGLVWQWAGLEE